MEECGTWLHASAGMRESSDRGQGVTLLELPGWGPYLGSNMVNFSPGSGSQDSD